MVLPKVAVFSYTVWCAIVAGEIYSAMAQKEVCPRDEIADPPGAAVPPIDRHGFAEGLLCFGTLCGVQSSLVRFTPSRAIAWGPSQWQAPLETLCFSPAFS